MNNTTKKGGFKNFWIYILFKFIFSFLVSVAFIVLDVIWIYNQGNETITTLQVIVFLIESVVLFLLNEFLVCKVTKKAANNTYLLSRFAFAFSVLTILFITWLLFYSINGGFKTEILAKYIFWIFLGIMIVKMGSYLLAKKIALKEKIEKKKLLFGGFSLYLLLIFIVFHLLVPSNLNKFLFNVFGSTDFSSKELKIYLTKLYGENCDTVSYFHQFSNEELQCFENLTIDIKFTTEDINKLTNLNELEINNIIFDNSINFSKNKELGLLKLNKTKINDLNSKDLGNIEKIILTEVDINTVNINDGNLTGLYIEKSDIDNLKVQGNVIEEVNATETPIKNLEISNTTKLEKLIIRNSTVETALLDNNISLENRGYGNHSFVEIEKINNLELKNTKNLNTLLLNSTFIFKNIKFLENKGFHLQDNSYLKLYGSVLYVPEGTKVKELLLENMTAVVKDYYHDLISCDNTGMCTYDAEEKRKIQGPESILGDHIEIYDNDIKIFEWLVFDYKKGEI